MNKQPVSYLQTDSRWGWNDYSAPGEKTTIRASGCGPTAMAMVLATWCDPEVTPATECAWALRNGYKAPHSGTYYGYFPPAGKRYGLEVERLNTANIYGNPNSAHHATAKAALDRGDLVIACMGKGNWTSSGHYVLVYGIDGNTIYINDPASTKKSRTRGDYSLFKKQVKYYWVIKRPSHIKDENEEEDDMIRYEKLKDVPNDWDKEGNPRATIEKLMDAGILGGDGSDPTGNGDVIDLSHDMVRTLILEYRGGAFDRKLKAAGMAPAVAD